MNNPTSPSLMPTSANSVRSMADSAVESTAKALESTREFTHTQLDKAEDTARDLRHQVENGIDRFAVRAQDMAKHGLHAAADATAKARTQVNHYADATGRYVTEQPVKSVLIAAAVGAGLAALVMSSRSRMHTRY